MTETSDSIHGLVLDVAKLFPDHEAVVVGEHRYLYRQLVSRIETLAGALKVRGVAEKDRVVYLGPNLADAYALLFATTAAGAVFVPANTKFKPREIEHLLRVSGATCLVLAPDLADSRSAFAGRLRELVDWWKSGDGRDATPALREVLALTDGIDGLDALATDEGQSLPAERWAPGGSRPGLMQFTSGTTGLPKGALLAHTPTVRMARSLAANFGLSPTDRYFVCNPICHLGGTTYSMFAAMSAAACFITLPAFDAAAALKSLRQERCTVVHGIDSHWVLLLEALDDTNFDGPLRLCSVGGSHELVKRVDRRFRPSVTVTCYGTTEVGGAPVASHYLDQEDRRLDTEGRPLSGVLLDIVDPASGRLCSPGQPGEIRIGGWSLMMGYEGMPEATAAQLDDVGRCRTGDLGIVDQDGCLRFLGRIKNIIRVGGENVSAEEIESILETNEQVEQAIAVPVPDETKGEVVFAYVVRRPGSALSGEELIDFALARLASFKVPQHVEFLAAEDLLLTASGKVSRIAAREAAARLMGELQPGRSS